MLYFSTSEVVLDSLLSIVNDEKKGEAIADNAYKQKTMMTTIEAMLQPSGPRSVCVFISGAPS
jgi:hypothetical protein